MFKKGYFFIIFFLFSLNSWAQFSYRNNCIDSCSSGNNPKSGLFSKTVFEADSSFGSGHLYKWYFSDGSSFVGIDSSNKSFITKPFANPGKYWVTLKVYNKIIGDSTIYSPKEIFIGKAPTIRLNKDSLEEVCTGSSVKIQLLSSTGGSHYWFPNGETSDEITVDKAGCYSVKVFSTDGSGCYAEKSVQVKLCGSYPTNFDQSQNGTGSDGGTSAEVNMPQWNLGDSLKVLFPLNGAPSGASSTAGPYKAPAQVAYYPLDIQGAKYLHGALNTNGNILANNQGLILANDLNGTVDLAQGTVIFPKKSCKGCNSSDYYIITSNKDSKGRIKLFYSLVDISANGGKGGILVKNHPLQSASAQEKILVQSFEDGYGLISFDSSGTQIRQYIFNQSGISEPNLSSLSNPVNYLGGTAKISRDNNKLAIVSATNTVRIYDISDNSPKEITNLTIPGEAYGLEFSPDGKLLYVSTRGVGSSIYQYYLDTASVGISATQHFIGKTVSGEFGAMGYDPVNQAKLFISVNGQKYYATIGKPNQRINKGIDDFRNLNYLLDNFKLNKNLGWGIPLAIYDISGGGGGSQLQLLCDGVDFKFKLPQDLCEKKKNTKVVWEFYHVRKGVKINYFLNEDGVAVSDISQAEAPILRYGKSTINVPFDPTGGIINAINQSKNINEVKLELAKLIDKLGPNVDPTATYIVQVRVWNECVEKDPKMKNSGYLYDAQQFDLRFLHPFRLKPRIDKIDNNILSNVNGTCDFKEYSIDSTVVAIPSNLFPYKDSIDLSVPDNPDLFFQWSMGDTTAKVSIPYSKDPKKFSLILSDLTTGCSQVQESTIHFISNENLPQGDAYYLCMDDPFPRVRMELLDSLASIRYFWTTTTGVIASTEPDSLRYLNIETVGDYFVNLRDDYNCNLSVKYEVKDRCLPKVDSPNAFTPNGDNDNDLFFPVWNWGNLGEEISAKQIPGTSRNYPGNNRAIIKSFRIYNRWGEMIFYKNIDDLSLFQKSNQKFDDYSWDGKVNGQLVPQDTYVWEVIYESVDFPEKGEMIKRGSVLVLY